VRLLISIVAFWEVVHALHPYSVALQVWPKCCFGSCLCPFSMRSFPSPSAGLESMFGNTLGIFFIFHLSLMHFPSPLSITTYIAASCCYRHGRPCSYSSATQWHWLRSRPSYSMESHVSEPVTACG